MIRYGLILFNLKETRTWYNQTSLIIWSISKISCYA